ncbi:GIY-YIG nuclease family protein [Marinomonas epiphytica]
MIKTRLNTLYTGVTTDVDRRFQEHQSGASKSARYLRGKAPLELMWQCEVASKREAMQLEYRIKRLPKRQKLALITGQLTLADLFEIPP